MPTGFSLQNPQIIQFYAMDGREQEEQYSGSPGCQKTTE
jgi:hypothetical protein